MKKNITINLFGTLYAIDEDAFEMLDSYLESMKKYFSRKTGGSEIADDIEHRVAELLWEKHMAGMTAVDINTVKDIISTIGNPEEMSGDSGDEAPHASFAEENKAGSEQPAAGKGYYDPLDERPRRAFFRDPDHKMLGGVCSGLTYYTGGSDPVPWRLAACLLLIFISPIVVAVYLMVWLIVPEAQTAEDRLRMKGQRVTPESLNEEIMMHQAYDSKPAPKSEKSGCLYVTFILLAILVCLPLLLVLGSGVGFMLGSMPLWGPHFHNPFAFHLLNNQPTLLFFGLLAVAVCILIYGIIRLFRQDDKPMPRWQVIMLLAIWIAAVFGMIWIVSEKGIA